MKTSVGSHSFFQDTRKSPQDEGGQTVVAREFAIILKKNLNQALVGLHTLGSARLDPRPGTSWMRR